MGAGPERVKNFGKHTPGEVAPVARLGTVVRPRCHPERAVLRPDGSAASRPLLTGFGLARWTAWAAEPVEPVVKVAATTVRGRAKDA